MSKKTHKQKQKQKYKNNLRKNIKKTIKSKLKKTHKQKYKKFNIKKSKKIKLKGGTFDTGTLNIGNDRNKIYKEFKKNNPSLFLWNGNEKDKKCIKESYSRGYYSFENLKLNNYLILIDRMFNGKYIFLVQKNENIKINGLYNFKKFKRNYLNKFEEREIVYNKIINYINNIFKIKNDEKINYKLLSNYIINEKQIYKITKIIKYMNSFKKYKFHELIGSHENINIDCFLYKTFPKNCVYSYDNAEIKERTESSPILSSPILSSHRPPPILPLQLHRTSPILPLHRTAPILPLDKKSPILNYDNRGEGN